MKRAEILEEARRDAAYAVRSLRRQPAFTAIVLLTLALGIGANTATFTLVDALMLRSVPVPHPEQLMSVGDPSRTGGMSMGTPRWDLASYPLYADLRDQNHVLSGLYATGRTGRIDVLVDRDSAAARAPGTASSGIEAEHPRGRFVSGNYFAVLQVPAWAGRTFTAADDRVPGGDPVVVISHDYWERRFGGSRSAIGRTISINGAPLTIIGIAPPGFVGEIVGQPTDIWIPIMMQPVVIPHTSWLTDRGTSWLLLMGRLAPGVTMARARTELTALERRSLLAHARADDQAAIERRLRSEPIEVGPGARGFSYYRRAYGPSLYLLLGAVWLVLLVVCANVANLMLSRATARGREMSVRMALGAGRMRLVRQLLTESLLLAAAGGALGLLVAWWGSTALLRLASGGPNPIPLHAPIDGRVLLFTGGLSLLAAVLFGLVPALRGTRVQLAAALRTEGRGVTGAGGGAGRVGLGKLLVVTQVALSLLLLIGTGMLVRSMRRLETTDIGVARDQLVIARLDAGRGGFEGARLRALMRDLVARVGRVPGVAGATLSENGIFSGSESASSIDRVEGFTARADTELQSAYDEVGPGYFSVVGAHLLRGRGLDARDDESAPKVAVVNETFARYFFPHGDALGRHFTTDSVTREIVGVVADIEEQALRAPPQRRFYSPMAQTREPPTHFYIEARAAGDPMLLVGPVRRALRDADPRLVVLSVDPLPDLIRDSISQDRLVAKVISFFGALALVLAALGLYGVMAYATVRRTSEFGVRLALGAAPGDVVRLVLGEAMLLVAAGVVIGLPVALAAVRLIRHQLYGVGLLDPVSIAIALVALALSAMLAGALPAARAARVGPMEALRAE